MILIRKANPNDGGDFAKLILLSSPYFPFIFGDGIEDTLQKIFCLPENLFSYKHTYFAEVNNKNVGLILGYDFKTKYKENFKTGFLLFKEIGRIFLTKISPLLKFNFTIGKLNKNEYYISNVAVYPEFQGKGIGKKLILHVETDAKKTLSKRIVLDVEKDNIKAIDFYKSLGYEIENEFKIKLSKTKTLNFYRMVKNIFY